ncbi:putative LRR receptor-like serine/threonine-protein kinase [Zea mays]|uniref:Putative LRR receptor-like serine/threonine-protein kinase n=1 Tax=Zea mays TaxID=4577 RepID=A0A3L6FBY4_MAIZE|nr:putative LRR receptor-like serine/threonine-protein kinase [Zea mays]
MLVVLLLLLCHAVDKVHCSTHHNNSQDFHSLLEFHKGITSDPHGALSNWNPSIHFCHWHGVNCSSTRPYRVTELNLNGQSLAGQISSSLGNLTFLQTLDLSNNSFSGPLPLLNKLRNLDLLLLGSNHLGDVIPDWLTNSSNLVGLDLSENNLTGHIPSNIGFLTKLEGIALYNNNLTGVIPPTLGNISTLGVVDFSMNQLSGSISNKVWQISNITMLNLGQNNLSGGIPVTLSKLSSLTTLGLNNNNLGGALPSNIGDVLPNLQELYLGGNNFVDTIPTSLGNPSNLEVIDLSQNLFSGTIPISFGNLSKLHILNLEVNMLEARDSEGCQFFDALANCSSLNTLSVSHNLLHGPIPNSISNLSTTLQYLVMGWNSLSGIVPPTIAKLSGLIELSLQNNNLTGKNNFSGSVPSTLWNLKISILDLSHNNFQGSIPIQFGNLDLISLNLSSNKFSGEIPKTLGQLQQIQTIQMDQNIFTGDIPYTFKSLYSLSLLNLSHNNLSGAMPIFLSCLSLSKLDLSYNNFQGEIPRTGVFNNSTVVSLDGNPGLCGGAMYLHMPPCHVASRRARRASLFIEILIPIFGFMSLVLLVHILLLDKRQSRRLYGSKQSFGEHFEKVTYNDLAQSTCNFSESNLIDRGRYGSVYRGKLKEMEVVVKVFDLELRGAERSFLSECEALRSIQHRNLIPIITACSIVGTFKALIFEFMPNGNLDTWIHHKGDEEATRCLGLTQRINIVVNIADALDYLHHGCGRPTVHCDLKPSNILLDDDMNALLGDFGIASFYYDFETKWTCSSSSFIALFFLGRN